MVKGTVCRFKLIDGAPGIVHLLGVVDYTGECAVDTETDGLHWSLGNKPFMATFSPDESSAYACYDPVIVGTLLRAMEKRGTRLKFHNAKFDLHMLRIWPGCDWYPEKGYVGLPVDDTMHAVRIQYPLESAALKSISQRFDPVYEGIDVTGPQTAVKEWIRDHTATEVFAGKTVKIVPGYDQVPQDIMLPYACQDTVMTLRLDHFLDRERNHWVNPNPSLPDQKAVYAAEVDCVKVCVEMERFGFPVHGDTLDRVTEEANAAYQKAQQAWKDSPWGETLPSSPTGLRKILYEQLQEPIKHRTKPSKSNPDGQAATDEAALVDCETPGGKQLAGLILGMRGWKKYLERLTEIRTFRARDGRVHTSLNSDRARTGRFSSTEPALQNLSRPDSDKPWTMARDLFRPEPGFEFLLADFSQIELRLAAHYMNDLEMMHTLATGGDLHRDTAAAMYGIAPEQVTKKQRAIAKIMNFSILYGAGVRRVTETLRYGAAGTDPLTIEEVHEALDMFGIKYKDRGGSWNSGSQLQWAEGQKMNGEPATLPDLTEEECYIALADKLLTAFHERRPLVRQFLNRASARAKANKIVYTGFGLGIPIPPPQYSPTYGKFISSDHKAGNAIIQGTAAGLMKATIVRAEKGCQSYCEKHGLEMWKDVAICMTIHDELIFQVPIGHAKTLAAHLDPSLSDWPQYRIPIKLEYAIVPQGSSWAFKEDFEVAA